MSAYSLPQAELASELNALERWAIATLKRVVAFKEMQMHDSARRSAAGIANLRRSVEECCVASGAAVELVAADILAVLKKIEAKAD